MDYEKLISGLNKHWRAVTEDYFWDNMDAESTNNAITTACFPKELSDWIWGIGKYDKSRTRSPFEVF